MLLLRNGCVIDTEPEVTVRRETDVLIDGDRIAAVGPNLTADAEVIDVTGRIVLPGLVDAHRHTWQALLRSVATDIDLMDYLDLVGHRLAARFTPADVRLGTLAGALECLDAGITTLQDYSHIQRSPEHTDAALDALRASGIRAVFAYGYPVTAPELRRPREVRRIRDQHKDGLVTLALGPLGLGYGPMADVLDDWRLAAELGLRIFVHTGARMVSRPIEALREAGLLTADTTYVHANSLDDGDVDLIADSGGAVAITPAVEARMGHGEPTVGRLRERGITTGLGVDVVTSVAGDLFSVLRATLLTSQFGRGPRVSPAEVLRMATIDGAAAVGLERQIGSLRTGKQADIAVVDARAVNLAGAVQHDPVGAVVTAAHPGNVEFVLVGGRFVKREGRLVDARTAEVGEAVEVAARRLAG
ncbi:amidohydrolase family protein [Fodinicola acaciae]|uniref:amidohydrolase family protein n=1 Tax=Fodinicola acaciae TaxID=2681555 RepID=UPI0013D22EE3|nr:amidohydrolase family protein [Fodinicola acaciae]